MLDLLAVVGRLGHEVVRRHTELCRGHVIQPADLVPAAARQPTVNRCRNAVRIEVSRRERHVVCEAEVPIPPSEIAGLHRHTRENLMLHARAELPVEGALPPPVDRAGVVGCADGSLSEVRVGQGSTFAVGQRAREIAFGDEIRVRISPAPRRAVDDSAIGSLRPGREGGSIQAEQVFVQTDLESGLAGSKHVVRDTYSRRDVLPSGSRLVGQGDVARGRELHGPERLFGKTALVRVKAHPAGEG